MTQKLVGKAAAQPQSRSRGRKVSYFDELVGRRVEVLTKYADDGSYHVYRGVFLGLEKGYLWLENCEIAIVKRDGSVENNPHIYPKIALNQTIVSQIRLAT